MKDKITLERIKLMHTDVWDEVNQIYDLIAQALSGRAICRFSYTLKT